MTPHFDFSTATHSNVAEENKIDNIPSPDERRNIELVANCIEQFYWLIGRITSWFRCLELNEAVGGAVGSRHTMGLAVDFRPPVLMTSYEVALILKGLCIPAIRKIIIYENSKHVHLSFWSHSEKLHNRNPTKYLISNANGSYSHIE